MSVVTMRDNEVAMAERERREREHEELQQALKEANDSLGGPNGRLGLVIQNPDHDGLKIVGLYWPKLLVPDVKSSDEVAHGDFVCIREVTHDTKPQEQFRGVQFARVVALDSFDVLAMFQNEGMQRDYTKYQLREELLLVGIKGGIGVFRKTVALRYVEKMRGVTGVPEFFWYGEDVERPLVRPELANRTRTEAWALWTPGGYDREFGFTHCDAVLESTRRFDNGKPWSAMKPTPVVFSNDARLVAHSIMGRS